MQRAATPREAWIPVTPRLRLHVVEWGDPAGWPVVILHGGSHNAACWADVCRRLPASLRLIVPDQRGHGASDWSPRGVYSCTAQVRDLRRVIGALGCTEYALVGHSMGGLNALMFASTRPAGLRALALVDVGTETRRSGMARVRQRPPLPQVMSTQEALRMMRARYPRQSPRWWRRQIERELRRVDEDTWRWGYDQRLARFVPAYGPDSAGRRRRAAAIRVPVLVVRGAHSRIMSRGRAAITARVTGGTVVAVPGAGHAVPLDNPRGLASALRRFLLPLAQEARRCATARPVAPAARLGIDSPTQLENDALRRAC